MIVCCAQRLVIPGSNAEYGLRYGKLLIKKKTEANSYVGGREMPLGRQRFL